VKTNNYPLAIPPHRGEGRGGTTFLNDIERNSMYHGVIDLLKAHHYLRDIRGAVFGKIGSFAVSILATYALESSKFVDSSVYKSVRSCTASLASLAARVTVGPVVTMMSILRRISSATSAGIRSGFPYADRHSMTMFFPSTYPSSRRP
jgi:hypothetical protein